MRTAKPGDTDSLLAMIRDHAAFERCEATISRVDLEKLVSASNPPAQIIVASVDGRALGYAALTSDYSLWRNHHWAHLDCLFVSAEARSSGVGSALLNRAKAMAQESGADRLEWQTPDWNERAARFYEREGASGSGKLRYSFIL